MRRYGLAGLLCWLTLAGPAGAAQLTLTWDGSDRVVPYAVEREAAPGTFVEIGRTEPGVLRYVDSSLLGITTYCYRVRAVLPAGGYTDYTNVACGSAPAGPGSLRDGFDRPDSQTLGNGWRTVSGLFTIRAGEARSGTATTLHAAVQPGLAGPTQKVVASFAVAQPGTMQRLGVLVRYGDPGNHYACYRQTGRLGVLRIARVVNGATTVLAQVRVADPAKGTFFSLGCKARGTALALSLDGMIKLTVADPTFSTGTVGMFVAPTATRTGPLGPHRADRFRATVQ